MLVLTPTQPQLHPPEAPKWNSVTKSGMSIKYKIQISYKIQCITDVIFRLGNAPVHCNVLVTIGAL